jgi:hypothetical protein
MASTSRCSSVSHSEVDESEMEDVSYSERIEEDHEEDDDDTSTSVTCANSITTTLEARTILHFEGIDDLFTKFTWSISQQDPDMIQNERHKLRDIIMDTPLFRAMERSRRNP